VATDFLAIYTAESDRHVMVDLAPGKHPWENDLAEATFISAFGVTVGKVMKDGELTDGNAREWWAKSKISNRSGIGNTRKDRRKLQQLITSFERENHPELVEAVENLIEVRNRQGDIFQGLMEHLNHFDTQDSVRENAKNLSDAFVEFLMQVRKDAKKIAAEIH
jgi:hypothetical protein